MININDYLLQVYIEKISKEDIDDFSKKQGIKLEVDEIDTIFYYLKNHWRTFYYGNPKHLLEELRDKLKFETYAKIETLYTKMKDKLN